MAIDTSHIVFIISNARSGSTMLRQLLNTNSAIGIPEREYGSLLSILKKIETYGDLSVKENFEKFYFDNEDIAKLEFKKSGFENTGKELYKATDKKGTSIDLKSLNLNYNYWDTLNYIKNIFMSFVPVVGVFKTVKLVFKKYVSKKRNL